MDGLSIRNLGTQGVGANGSGAQGIGASGTSGIQSPNGSGIGPNSTGKSDAGPTFGDTLKDAMNSVNTLQKSSDTEMQKLATGKSESLHETMIAAEKADIALRLMVQVRNKVIDAYNDIMKMQV